MHKHIMIDIETLGRKPGCCVLSIGACAFSADGVEVLNKTHIGLDIEDQQYNYQCHVDTQTLKWWFKQSNQSALNPDGAVPLKQALHTLSQYISDQGKDIYVWANSPQFDIAILDELYRRAGEKAPWQYYQILDFRTISALNPELHKAKKQRAGYHNALDDAEAQAEVLAEIFSKYDIFTK